VISLLSSDWSEIPVYCDWSTAYRTWASFQHEQHEPNSSRLQLQQC